MTIPVTLTFPAETINVAMARSIAASMAARADFTIDQLDDARLAVDEAVAQVLTGCPQGANVTCAFEVDGDRLSISVVGPWQHAEAPSTTSFAWTVLTALCTEVDADVTEGHITLRVALERADSAVA